MATKKQFKTLDKYVDVIQELLVDQIHALREGRPRQLDNNRMLYARMFGQLLYEAPKIFTGQVSVDMVDRKLHDFRVKPCPEHYLSRQRGGEALVNLIAPAILTGIDPPRIIIQNIALTYCAVHYTTPEENARLKHFQKHNHDETAYSRAGIVLIEARDLFTKRGHSEVWKQQMRSKYSPIVQHYLTTNVLIKDNQ